MDPQWSHFGERLGQRGVSRRRFLQVLRRDDGHSGPARPLYRSRCTMPCLQARRPPLVWLEFQDCTGDTESFLRAQPALEWTNCSWICSRWTTTRRSWLPSGEMTERVAQRHDDHASQGQYICVVEGSIPTAAGGIHCMIRGRTALSIAQEVCRNALATIAVGTCAWEGGIAAARTQSHRGRGRQGMPCQDSRRW